MSKQVAYRKAFEYSDVKWELVVQPDTPASPEAKAGGLEQVPGLHEFKDSLEIFKRGDYHSMDKCLPSLCKFEFDPKKLNKQQMKSSDVQVSTKVAQVPPSLSPMCREAAVSKTAQGSGKGSSNFLCILILI